MKYFAGIKSVKIFFLIFSAVTITGNNHKLQAQINQTVFSNPILPGAPVYKDGNAFASNITITDREGRPFANNYSDVEGSPFFIDYYCPAFLGLNKGKEYQNIKTKLNLNTHEVLLIDSIYKEVIAIDGLVKNIFLIDSSGTKLKTYKFRSGYPPVDKNSSNQFYQVLSDGRLQLLKFIKKDIVERKDVMSGEVRKEFVLHEDYFAFSNGEIKRLKKDKEYIEDLMKDKEEKIREYQKEKKVNFKSISDLVSLFDYYNSLPFTKAF